MNQLPSVLIGFAVFLQATGQPAKSFTLDLGGLQQAKAVLVVSESDYVMKVRMLPVRSFDAATNSRLNRDKARGLALLALARHLSGKKSVAFTVSGARIETVGSDGGFYALTLRVQRSGVSLVREAKEPSQPAKQEQERAVFDEELFTRKREYLSTLENLATTLSADLQETAKSTGDSFALAIAEIEERETKNLESLGRDIRCDKLLLSIEQQELNEAVAKQEKKMLRQLKAAVQEHDGKE